MRISRAFRAHVILLVAAPLIALSVPKVARAADNGQAVAIVIFYGALAISQSQAMQAASHYYDAIGMDQQAQQYLRLANDFKSGTLGGEDGVKTFAQANANLASDILELQAIGAFPNARQLELAKKADSEFTAAKIAMTAAIVSGTATVLQGKQSLFEKIALGIVMGAQGYKVNQSLEEVSKASQAYRNLELGAANGFQIISKEALPAFAQL